MDPPVCSGVNWQSKAIRYKHQQTVLASVFWNAPGILFIDNLEKGRTINSKYIALLVHLKEEITKKQQQMKCSFTRTMQRWQNCMNCTLNCFRTHPLLQIWPPVATGCLQTSKECSRESNLAPMKKWYWRLSRIETKDKPFYIKASDC